MEEDVPQTKCYDAIMFFVKLLLYVEGDPIRQNEQPFVSQTETFKVFEQIFPPLSEIKSQITLDRWSIEDVQYGFKDTDEGLFSYVSFGLESKFTIEDEPNLDLQKLTEPEKESLEYMLEQCFEDNFHQKDLQPRAVDTKGRNHLVYLFIG